MVAFAHTIGIDRVTLWRYETGRSVPRAPKELDALEKAGVSRQLLDAAVVSRARAVFA